MIETTSQLVLNGGQIELFFDNLDTSIYHSKTWWLWMIRGIDDSNLQLSNSPPIAFTMS